MRWVPVCALDDLIPDRGVCAKVGPHQVAVFRTGDDNALFAVSNYDPFAKANVMSRGIVGSAGEVAKVASPMHKHNFELATGRCLGSDDVFIPTFEVRCVDGQVEVALPEGPEPGRPERPEPGGPEPSGGPAPQGPHRSGQ